MSLLDDKQKIDEQRKLEMQRLQQQQGRGQGEREPGATVPKPPHTYEEFREEQPGRHGMAGPPSKDFFGGKKNTNYSAGTGNVTQAANMARDASTAFKSLDQGREVPAMAEPGDPGYTKEDEIVG